MWDFLQQKWPLVFISAGMIVAAVIDGWKFKVPNWLTFPLIITGWILGAIYMFTDYNPYLEDGSNRLAASLLGTAVGFALLFPLWLLGGMGAGDVKMQMGFGSWVGAYFGINHGLWIVVYSFCFGAIIGGILGLILAIPRYRMHLQNAQEILKDFATSAAQGSVAHAADKAAERKPRMKLLPYGVPLCIGFLTYLTLHHYQKLPTFLSP
jgi:prepilin peptidase CpaA